MATVQREARVWIHGTGAGPRSVPLSGEFLIGRGEHCSLTLADETVSGDHAEISCHGRSYYLTDLHSRNGTAVNGKQIHAQVKLRSGDVVVIGPYRLEIQLPTAIQTVRGQPPSVVLDEAELAVARALVAPYRDEEAHAGRPATRGEIAAALHLSESTVKRRLAAVAGKLGVPGEPRRDRPQRIADRVISLGLDRDSRQG